MRSLLPLAVLVWASCGGSSGGNTGGTLGGGGVTGVDGAAGSGPPSGSTAGDASPSGGYGGTTGGYGGTTGGGYGGTGSGGSGYGGSWGGTPSPCMDPAYPVSCPARNDVPAICWSTGTDCSTVTKCGDQFRSCLSASTHFDCAQMTCVPNAGVDGGAACGPDYPVSCPAKGDVPGLCWSTGTVCSTIGRCGNDFKSCQAAGYHFDCTQQRCLPDSGTPADAGTADAVADATTDAHVD
jgi:hypothetical protein